MTPLVLLPGMMCDARLYGPQVAALSAGGRSVTVAPLTGADSVTALADLILATAPDRFALAGLSMGGIVAMAVITRAPGRVDRLALIDTNPRAEAAEVAANRDRQIAKVRAGGLEGVMRDELKPNYLAHGPGRTAVLDLCMDMALTLGKDVFCRQSRALQTRPDQTAALSNIRVPTLVMMGAHDRLCPFDRHALMAAKIPGAHLQVIANAGHLPVLEQPEATTAALHRWLSA